MKSSRNFISRQTGRFLEDSQIGCSIFSSGTVLPEPQDHGTLVCSSLALRAAPSPRQQACVRSMVKCHFLRLGHP